MEIADQKRMLQKKQKDWWAAEMEHQIAVMSKTTTNTAEQILFYWGTPAQKILSCGLVTCNPEQH